MAAFCNVNCLLFFLLVIVGPSTGQTTTRRVSSISQVNVLEGSLKVQVFHGGEWTYICANNWDNRDAQVICRMQGYWHGQGTAELRGLEAGDTALMDNMDCDGNETTLDQCNFDGFRVINCGVGAVAAVRCEATRNVQVRLSDGFGRWEGRVEVSDPVWRPICNNDFSDEDAQVVCRMLGVRNDGGKARIEDKFSASLQSPIIRRLDCDGTETDILQCKGTVARKGEQCTTAGVECYNCGDLYTAPNGTIQSENYPLSYPRNLNCLYIVRPSDEQQLYKLEFADFSTEACCDSLDVKILTGSSNVPGGSKYSGSVRPPRFLGKAFALNFVTDGSHALTGFHARWSPARVEDVVTVTCSEGHFVVDIDFNFLKRLYPLSSEVSIALADPRCVGSITAVNGEDHLVIESDTDDCGTHIVSAENVIQYNNFLVDRVYADETNMIVRGRRWEIPIHCTVVRTDGFEVHYNPVPNGKKRDVSAEDILPEVVRLNQEGNIAQNRPRREVQGSISLNSNFPISIIAYQDSTYTFGTSGSGWALSHRLGEDIYLRVHLSGGDPDLKVVLQNCYTKPLSTSNTTYFLIENGCTQDSSTKILSIQQHMTDFKFTAFEFAGDFPRVYLVCDVRVCAANENSSECTQECASSGKRSVSESNIIRHHSSSSTHLYSVSFGPIVLQH